MLVGSKVEVIAVESVLLLVDDATSINRLLGNDLRKWERGPE